MSTGASMPFTSPFAASTAQAGHGSIELAILPPNTPVLRNLSYQYPLKLVAPDPLPPPDHNGDVNVPNHVHTVFLLTYGGGIVAGDGISLSVVLDRYTRLILLTQGSTKIFKTPDPKLVSAQHMTVHLQLGSALVYLPDPVQPFAHTSFSQSQVYHLEDVQGNLCVCDWVTSGRSARGEDWDIYEYKSRNEVWSSGKNARKRLLLRDNLILDHHGRTDMRLSARMHNHAVFGTLIIHGPAFESLSQYFLDEFGALPRIGGRNWGDTVQPVLTPEERRRANRQKQERLNGLIWSAARVRGFVLVKFASRDVEGARHWLKDMIWEEKSILEKFGERAMLCLK